MSKVGVEMKDMGQAAAAAAPVAAPVAASPVAGYTVAEHREALNPLKTALNNLGRARDNLTRVGNEARGWHDQLHFNFWKQGSEKHHNSAPKRIGDLQAHIYNKLENNSPGITTDLQNAHRAIPAAIDGVRRAHDNLLRDHQALAEKSGKRGAKTRTFINDDGHHFSLGNYHGKKHTDPGDGVTIVKGTNPRVPYARDTPHHRLFGGRKTRKHRRKHKRKHKRKTRKHKRKRKTKKRKHHRRKHKRKTRRR